MPGLNINFLNLSLNSDSASNHTVWMDPDLWGECAGASDGAHPRILATSHSSTNASRMQEMELSASDAHLPQYAEAPIYPVPLVRSHGFGACIFRIFFLSKGARALLPSQRLLYCQVSSSWFNMSLNFLPFPDLYITSVGGGLLCFVAHKGTSSTPNREVVLGICNPATHSWRLLPCWGSSGALNLPAFVAMIVDNFNGSYKVVLIDYDRTVTRLYNSSTMSWTESENVPAQHDFPYYDRTPTEAVVRNGSILVCATQCKTGVSNYDMDTGLWESYHVFLPGMHSNVHLLQLRGRILMISRVMKQKYEGSNRIQISELDRKGLRVTKDLSEVPLGPSKQFLDHYKVCNLSGPKTSEQGLCFVSMTTGERWVYDLEERFWRIMPSWSTASSKSMAAFGGFSIQLRVDIQP